MSLYSPERKWNSTGLLYYISKISLAYASPNELPCHKTDLLYFIYIPQFPWNESHLLNTRYSRGFDTES
jgi:hypothetical protein